MEARCANCSAMLQVSARETACPDRQLVMRDEHADWRGLDSISGNVEPRHRSEPANKVLVDLGIFESANRRARYGRARAHVPVFGSLQQPASRSGCRLLPAICRLKA